MKKRVATLVAASLIALPLTVIGAGPASACDRQPCYTVCKVNPDYVDVDENGTVTVGNGRLVDCYY
jgi:hypothetical protein